MCLCVCVSKKNYAGIQSANALVSGSGSDIPLIQDIEPSNSRARLGHATLRCISRAEILVVENSTNFFFDPFPKGGFNYLQ